jgi:hypothetical protein
LYAKQRFGFLTFGELDAENNIERSQHVGGDEGENDTGPQLLNRAA